MTKIDELISIVIVNTCIEEAADRLSEMLRLAVEQRDSLISGYDNYDWPNELLKFDAELLKIAKGEK